MTLTLNDPDLLRQQAYIDGQWVDADSGATFPVYDPATGEAIKWFTSPAQQKARYLAMGVPPCRPAVFDDADVKAKYAFAEKLKGTFESLKPRPVTPFYGQMSANVIQPVFGKVTTKAITPEEGIKEMADGMRKIMKG